MTDEKIVEAVARAICSKRYGDPSAIHASGNVAWKGYVIEAKAMIAAYEAARPAPYICPGCNVREPWEHRCHKADGERPCECPECSDVHFRSEAARPDHVMVPREPTWKMKGAVDDEKFWPLTNIYGAFSETDCQDAAGEIYKAMLAAHEQEQTDES